MRKTIIASAVIGILSVPAIAVAEDAPPASPLSFNVGVVSDYLFRGVSQTHGGPAVQGGIDFAHSSGFYVGAWASNITWVKDAYGKGSLEVDVYGGYKNTFAGDWTYDVGYITYNYPGHGNAIAGVNANPNTQEAYGSIGYKWLSAKYSYATSSHFIGWAGGSAYDQKTRGSSYIELNANYDLGDGWTLIGHVGQQKVKDYVKTAVLEDADYTDWKIGGSKDVGFGVVTVYYSDTNAKGSCSGTGGTSSYCWGDSGAVSGTSGATSGFKNVARGTAVVSFTKTF
jgi:uncharacterized protein (TIGR02001 family)